MKCSGDADYKLFSDWLGSVLTFSMWLFRLLIVYDSIASVFKEVFLLIVSRTYIS